MAAPAFRALTRLAWRFCAWLALAPGVYFLAGWAGSPIHTCNQWTGDMLADAGVPVGWWTPFAGSVMKWVPPIIPPAVSPS